MDRYTVILLLAFLLAGCAPRTATTPGEETASARRAAEGAFVELEGGAEVPLPGMTPTDIEAVEGDLETEAAVAAARAAFSYDVQSGWFMVDTALIFPNTVSPEAARRDVLQVARGAGLEQALPQKVSFTSLLSDIMDESAGAAYEKSTWSTFALSSVTGHVIDEKVLSAKLTPLKSGNAYSYRVVLEARVVPVKGQRDPSLRLELEVNERVLRTGDELVVRARSTTDGYLYLFDFLSDNSVMLMFPNSYLNDNAVKAGQWLEVPTQAERDRGVRYRVALADELPTANETVYAVYCRKPIADLTDLINVSTGYATFTAGDQSFTDFQRWLADIPLDQRVEKAVQLHIINEKE